MKTKRILTPKETFIALLLTIFYSTSVLGQTEKATSFILTSGSDKGEFGWYTTADHKIFLGSYWKRDLDFFASNNSSIGNIVMTIKNNRRVGIGTDSPGEKLTVNGNLELTGDKRMFKGASWVSNYIGSLSDFGTIDVGFYTKNADIFQIVTKKRDQISLGSGRNGDAIINMNATTSDNWARIGSEGELAFFTSGHAKLNEKPAILINKDSKVIVVGDASPPSISAANLNKYEMFVEKGILSEDYGLGPKSTWADYVFSPNYKLKPLSEVKQYISQNKHLPNMPSQKEIEENGYSLHEMNVKLLEKIEELTLYTINQEQQIQKWSTTYQQLKEDMAELKESISKQ